MRHPELDDMPNGASFFGYQPGTQYVAVGQPVAPVAPVAGHPPASAAPGTATPTNMGPFMMAIAASFIGGAGLAGAFVYQQPTAQETRYYQQEAQRYEQRATQHEQRIVEIQQSVCPAFY